MTMKTYTDEDINTFLELAQEIGITKAKRELGYPKSWGTAQRWAVLRKVEIPVDEVMAKASATNQWFRQEEVMTISQDGMQRVWEDLTTNTNLSPDDQKKLAEALQKHYNVWASAQGKAQTITETRSNDGFDARIEEMLAAEKAKNMLRKDDEVSNR